MQLSSDPPAAAETSTTDDEPEATDSFPVCEDEVRDALERVLSEEEAQEVWLDVCEAAQIPRPGPALGPEEITRVVEHLKQQPGTASVVGNSLSVKIRTHKHR